MKYYLTQEGRELLSEFALGGSVDQHYKQSHEKYMQGQRQVHQERMAKIAQGITDKHTLDYGKPKNTKSTPVIREPADRTSPQYKKWHTRYGHLKGRSIGQPARTPAEATALMRQAMGKK